MSYEAWNEDDSGAPDGYITVDESDSLADEAFVLGAQACREMLARFVENAGDQVTAASIRANWHPGWGEDPGRPEGDIAVLNTSVAELRVGQPVGSEAKTTVQVSEK